MNRIPHARSMQLLDLSLPTVAENLALDEALLDESNSASETSDLLRLWELPRPAVVMGRSTQRAGEVNDSFCQQRDIPVCRRVTGGLSIVGGPGCLMYSLLLSRRERFQRVDVSDIHCLVLRQLTAMLRQRNEGAQPAGTSDLALVVDDGSLRKFSGNSLRIRQHAILYHGTLLYDFDLSLIDQCLQKPPREPEYRDGRGHQAFVVNLPATRGELKRCLVEGWNAAEPKVNWPQQAVAQLVKHKYTTAQWNE